MLVAVGAVVPTRSEIACAVQIGSSFVVFCNVRLIHPTIVELEDQGDFSALVLDGPLPVSSSSAVTIGRTATTHITADTFPRVHREAATAIVGEVTSSAQADRLLAG